MLYDIQSRADPQGAALVLEHPLSLYYTMYIYIKIKAVSNKIKVEHQINKCISLHGGWKWVRKVLYFLKCPSSIPCSDILFNL